MSSANGDKDGMRPRSKSTLTRLAAKKVQKALSGLGEPDTPTPPPSAIVPSPSHQPVSVFHQNIPSNPDLLEEGIPKIVHQLCKYILENAPKLEGLFRVAPSAGEVKKCIATIEDGSFPDFESIPKASHVAAAILKTYFRGLPEPLLTYELYDMFIAASSIGEPDTRVQKIRQVISYLPSQNYTLLVFLVFFLREVAKFAQETKMHTENLSIVFAPNILKPKKEVKDENAELQISTQLLVTMIDELDRVFEGCKHPKYFSDGKDHKKENTTPVKEVKEKKPKQKAAGDIQDNFFEDVRHSRTENITRLMQAGKVDLNAFDPRGWSALMMAVHRSDIAMMDVLIREGCDINLQTEKKETALLRAVVIGSVESVKFLLEKGAKHDIVNEEGQAPLHVASYAGEVEICEHLIEGGAIVDLRDPSQKTPLLLAAFAGHKDVCSLLLQKGASHSKYDEYGWTPLMLASYSGHAEVVSLLLESGASSSATNKKGKNAAVIAAQAKHEDISKLLAAARSKKKSKRQSVAKSSAAAAAGNDEAGAFLAVTTVGLPKSKSPKQRSPATEISIDFADADLSSSPGNSPRGKKSKRKQSAETAPPSESAPPSKSAPSERAPSVAVESQVSSMEALADVSDVSVDLTTKDTSLDISFSEPMPVAPLPTREESDEAQQ